MLKLGSTAYANELEVISLTNVSYLSSANLILNKVNGGDLYWTFSILDHDENNIFGQV